MKGKGQKMNIVICDDERKVIEDVGSVCRECLSPDVKLYGAGNRAGGEFVEKS